MVYMYFYRFMNFLIKFADDILMDMHDNGRLN